MSEERINYYKTLGVKSNALPKTIKAAHRKLAKKFHPDAAENAEQRAEFDAKFKVIQEAYEILMDARKRKLYDAGHDVNERSIQMAKQEIANLFNNVLIEQYRVYTEDSIPVGAWSPPSSQRSINMLKRINNHFSSTITNKEEEIKKIDSQLKFMEKMAGKITTADEDNLYAFAWTKIVDDLNQIKASAELLIDNLKLCIELIENYKEEFPNLYRDDNTSDRLMLSWDDLK